MYSDGVNIPVWLYRPKWESVRQYVEHLTTPATITIIDKSSNERIISRIKIVGVNVPSRNVIRMRLQKEFESEDLIEKGMEWLGPYLKEEKSIHRFGESVRFNVFVGGEYAVEVTHDAYYALSGTIHFPASKYENMPGS